MLQVFGICSTMYHHQDGQSVFPGPNEICKMSKDLVGVPVYFRVHGKGSPVGRVVDSVTYLNHIYVSITISDNRRVKEVAAGIVSGKYRGLSINCELYFEDSFLVERYPLEITICEEPVDKYANIFSILDDSTVHIVYDKDSQLVWNILSGKKRTNKTQEEMDAVYREKMGRLSTKNNTRFNKKRKKY